MKVRILSLIVYRLFLVALVLIYQLLAPVTAFFPSMHFPGIFYVSLFILVISTIYVWYLKFRYNESRIATFIFCQFIIDILCITILIPLNGGYESNIPLAYLMVILLSAIFLEKISIYVITVIALSFYYFSLVFGPFLVGIHQTLEFDRGVQYALMGQFVLCFLTALLSGFMQTVYRSGRKALHEKEARIRSMRIMRHRIVESLPSGLLTCTRDGGINFVNQAGIQLLKRGLGHLTTISAWHLFQIEPEQTKDEPKERYLSRAEREVWVNDERRVFGISYSPLEFDSGRVGYLFVFQDLTKIKLLENEKMLTERMSAIGKVAAGVAHEIRNPLAAISGSIQILKEMMPADQSAEDLALIVARETRRLNDIISQFLEYARPGSPPEFKPVDLSVCLGDFVRLTQNDEDLSTLETVLHMGSGEPIIWADESKLNQVFWNLLRNSFQASEAGGRIDLSCTLENQAVMFKIQDQGKGMTAEQVKDLFTPFQSFSQSGTGLGMSIVYEIIKIHQGQILVDSQPGEGTCITLKFPKYKQ